MMKNQSLQDQLLKSGLANNNQAKQVRAEKRKQTKKQRKNKVEVVDETKQLVQEARTKQIEKDKLLNQQRNQEAEKKQLANQIAQLIELNKLTKNDDGVAYKFTDKNVVKSIYISEDLRNKIIAGKLAVVKSGAHYEVVPAKVAEKIQQRNEQAVIVLFAEKEDEDVDDDYKDFEIPDDLMW
jgi:uncharacterized protein YaiL (DUF2058 family)